LGAELSHHLGYVSGGTKPEDTTNHRNGSSGKTVLTDDGPWALAVPRDRDGSFEPRLIGKHERRFTGFDDKVVALYARGLTLREIQAFLAEMYGVDVSPDLISTVTDAVVAEVTAWQARPLEPMYPVVFFDARASRFAMRPLSAARPFTWGSRCSPTVRATSSGSGSSRPKARSSG
jgi:putative transposase